MERTDLYIDTEGVGGRGGEDIGEESLIESAYVLTRIPSANLCQQRAKPLPAPCIFPKRKLEVDHQHL